MARSKAGAVKLTAPALSWRIIDIRGSQLTGDTRFYSEEYVEDVMDYWKSHDLVRLASDSLIVVIDEGSIFGTRFIAFIREDLLQ